MKTIQLGNLDVKYGGPALSLSLIMRGLRENGVESMCLMEKIFDTENLIDNSLPITYLNHVLLPSIYSFFTNEENSYEIIRKFDILHIQGLWGASTYYTARYARKYNKPYILSPRGTLYPQALALHKWKKQLAMVTMMNDSLTHANCIHATCVEERDYYWELGFKNPVAILPNAFDLSKVDSKPKENQDKFRVGYLGRLHPRKHVERLIYAFADLRDELKDAELLIIGSDIPEYENFLKSETERLNLKNVKFTGFLTGEDKDNAIRSLSVMVLPSDFENFGNVVPDALARGVPVVCSKGAPWQSLVSNKCGWWIENSQEEINRTILEVKSKSSDELLKMGANGIHFVENELSYEVLGKKIKSLYEWIIDGGKVPDFVYFPE